MRGNVDFDEEDKVTVVDITFLINHVFRGGPAPDCLAEADVTADGKLAVADITFLIAYVFRGGPAPVACP
ncbi:MAG TPA: dockerin type I domain-containing protein [candidate division Zixibacteria bacterium]|nr:dockerin type I domain-containing protein [candidate division Zixibacteria bacterium]MDM7972449.1 dockerin type I domain-containing protein [candidate division Zixibacteria bacterium]HOD66543.1 dockerin type I domain-containing protein [candidate division Zixibacteria bacterium]HPM38237.1 dockerin type I domain-containing protein [candidate division Zixibacteria bacterium]